MDSAHIAPDIIWCDSFYGSDIIFGFSLSRQSFNAAGGLLIHGWIRLKGFWVVATELFQNRPLIAFEIVLGLFVLLFVLNEHPKHWRIVLFQHTLKEWLKANRYHRYKSKIGEVHQSRLQKLEASLKVFNLGLTFFWNCLLQASWHGQDLPECQLLASKPFLIWIHRRMSGHG